MPWKEFTLSRISSSLGFSQTSINNTDIYNITEGNSHLVLAMQNKFVLERPSSSKISQLVNGLTSHTYNYNYTLIQKHFPKLESVSFAKTCITSFQLQILSLKFLKFTNITHFSDCSGKKKKKYFWDLNAKNNL